MDSLPDDVIQHILSNFSNAKDLAPFLCVSKNFKRNMTYHKTLCFPRGLFDKLKGPQIPDCIVTNMVSSIPRLEELTVSCPFTSAGLASWLSVVGSSLKYLELYVAYDHKNKFPDHNLDCIQSVARNLETLRLWRVVMTPTPKWDVFQKLRNLEIIGAKLEDSILKEALRVAPNLSRLVLRSCHGLPIVCIEHLELRQCELYAYEDRNWCSLTLRAPKLEYLEVKNYDRIIVREANCLKDLSISYYTYPGKASMVDFDNLMELESLYVQGDVWAGDLICKILQLATEVKHLHLRFRLSRSSPFPNIDFVKLFESHPKLESLNIGGEMLLSVCGIQNPMNVVSSLVIPCLEEVVIIVDERCISESAELIKTIMRMFNSLVKYGNKLKKMKIRTSRTLTKDGTADCIFDKICSVVDFFGEDE